MNSRNLQQTGVGFIHSPGPDVVGHHTRLQDKGQFESRWDRKECQWCSLAEVHLPDMCKAQSSTFSSRKKKKKKKNHLKQEVIERQCQQEVARGLPGKQPCPLAWHGVSAYAMHTWMPLSSASPVCLGLGFVAHVSSLWLCFFPYLPQ